MTTQTIEINDSMKKNVRDALSIVPRSHLRGSVEVFEKDKQGKLTKIREKHNLIVYTGRNWLLYRAFGTAMTDTDPNLYNKVIKWFALGNGGGEAGNPLQAGATLGSDTNLLSPIRLRDDLTIGDPAFAFYASDLNGAHGWYKTFSSVIIKEDHSNPYVDNGVTVYPPLIGEIRIEISSDDANSGSYEDINEAGLFVADPTDSDPGKTYFDAGGSGYGGVELTGSPINAVAVFVDGDYAIYRIDSEDLDTDIPGVSLGDYIWTERTDGGLNNIIPESAPSLIVDVYKGQAGTKAYIVVEKPDAVEETTLVDDDLKVHIIDKSIQPYIMFSRVTFSTIRKTVDREIVFLWKIYF
jgi:hypothetical protein